MNCAVCSLLKVYNGGGGITNPLIVIMHNINKFFVNIGVVCSYEYTMPFCVI